jgi:hypothetical protein
MVVDVVHCQIDGFAARGSVDLVSEFAHPSGIIIGCPVGLDHDESLQIQALGDRAFRSIAHTEFETAMSAFAEFILSHLHQRKEQPRDDFLSRLASGTCSGISVDDGIALQIFVARLGGGFHSTASGISGLINHVLPTLICVGGLSRTRTTSRFPQSAA